MSTKKAGLEYFWLRFVTAKDKLSIGAKFFACALMVEITSLLVCNIAGLKIFAYVSEPLAPVPFWPIRLVALVLGPAAIVLTYIGFGITDIAQELLPTSFKNEIHTTAAMKVVAHLIGADIVALAVAYYLDPYSAPFAYTTIMLGVIYLLYTMSPYPKSVVKSEGKK